MQLAIIGAGWVGVTTAAAFADIGHTVVCADLNAERIAKLNNGEVPFFEPGLSELLARALASGRLQFTTDNAAAMQSAEIVFCCVNTPTNDNGVTDLQAVMGVANDFANVHADGAVFVIKSTVPAGTAAQVRDWITQVASAEASSPSHGGVRGGCHFTIASNPEFLAESTAIRDTLTPSRIVIGANDPETLKKVSRVYAPIAANGARIFTSDCATAEVIKTASNSFLATRISFMNEIANYCNQVGADPMGVAQGMGLDPRIGSIRPGVGYGGGCFPKDVQALLSEGNRTGALLTVLQSAHDANYRQRVYLYDQMAAALEGVAGKRVAILGLAFKPKTDDVRDAPAITFIDRLLAEGANVIAYDPQVKPAVIQDRAGLEFAESALEAAKDADAVALMCEWQEFQDLDLKTLQATMKGLVLVDGRYVWSRAKVEELGFVYIV
ncbi:MAG: UDP-glucose/GDP-mannose dehydrogenase family protein [Patescibacteria group bacterium]